MEQKVNGPAIGLIVTAVLGAAVAVLDMLSAVLGFSIGAIQSSEVLENFVSAGLVIAITVVWDLIGIGVCAVIFTGAQKMQKLQGYNHCIAASVLAMIPCFGCCIVGLPIGIWSLVVLLNAEVKAAFRS